MKLNQKATTRREFLKQSAGAAGAVMISGITSACASSAPVTQMTEKEMIPAPEEWQNFKIFSKGQIGRMTVKNRIIRSATMIGAASGGESTKLYIDMHRELSQGGVGLIITGVMTPTKDGAVNHRQMHIYNDRHVNSLRKVAEAVHEANHECKIFAQIGHSGDDVGPSGIRWPFPWKKKGRVLKTDEVDDIVFDFSKAIYRVKQSGFDGVELHGAHAYLLSTFLSPLTNKREDKYGGSLEKRVEIIKQIMNQSRDLVGPDFPIIIKLNSEDNAQGGIEPATFHDLAEEIVKTGIDALDVSGNDCLKENIDKKADETYFLKGAQSARVKTPIIVTGGNRSLDHMEQILQKKDVDFFGIARPLIREPDLPNRWIKGMGDVKADCISCNGCFGIIMTGRTAYCVQDA